MARSGWEAGSILLVVGTRTVAGLAVLLPMAISSIPGGYLFFAQHGFKRMIVLSP